MMSWNKFWNFVDREMRKDEMFRKSSYRTLEIIAESIKIINESKNWKTKKSRISVIIQNAERLINTSPFKDTVEEMQANMLIYKQKQIEIHIGAFKDAVNFCVKKACAAKTPKAKQSAYAKANDIISDVEANDSFVPEEEIAKMKRMISMGLERLNADLK